LPKRSLGPAFLVLSLAVALGTAGCSVFGRGGGGGGPTATASTEPTAEGQIDVRRYLGPNYCPELRILDGAELLRRYERGREGDAAYVIWQASFGDTARECLYNPDGSLTLKIGVSGRIIAGPKSDGGDVSVPFKIAVVKFKESTLATQGFTVAANLSQSGSTTFSEVHEVTVPGPGSDRDYIIYLGFEVGDWDLEKGVAVVEPVAPPAPRRTVVQEPVIVEEPPQAEQKPQPAPQQNEPNVLPTPSDGFILQ
jgi:hypothetical protein